MIIQNFKSFLTLISSDDTQSTFYDTNSIFIVYCCNYILGIVANSLKGFLDVFHLLLYMDPFIHLLPPAVFEPPSFHLPKLARPC